jgi:hypothetical protein
MPIQGLHALPEVCRHGVAWLAGMALEHMQPIYKASNGLLQWIEWYTHAKIKFLLRTKAWPQDNQLAVCLLLAVACGAAAPHVASMPQLGSGIDLCRTCAVTRMPLLLMQCRWHTSSMVACRYDALVRQLLTLAPHHCQCSQQRLSPVIT